MFTFCHGLKNIINLKNRLKSRFVPSPKHDTHNDKNTSRFPDKYGLKWINAFRNK